MSSYSRSCNVQNDSMESELMCNNTMKIKTFRSRLINLLAAAAFTLLAAGCITAFAQSPTARPFSSAEEASNALFQAVRNRDEQQLNAILGVDKDVTSSGDEIEDTLEREQFTEKYQQMSRLVREADGSTILYIGAENWPFPIPLVSNNGVWRFDTDAGRQEILFRTIGENESTAIEVCDAFAVAKKDASVRAQAGNDPISAYAQNLVSLNPADPWNASPFHGYYFRSIEGTGNVRLIAYPAAYRSSGIETFLITRDGVVYGKDLGPNTSKVAPKVRLNSSWHLEGKG